VDVLYDSGLRRVVLNNGMKERRDEDRVAHRFSGGVVE